MTDERPMSPDDGQVDRDEAQQVRCRVCHCQHCPVSYTRRRDRGIMRKRRCRHCGHEFITWERPL